MMIGRPFVFLRPLNFFFTLFQPGQHFEHRINLLFPLGGQDQLDVLWCMQGGKGAVLDILRQPVTRCKCLAADKVLLMTRHAV